jgi:hypothetical protein
MMSTELLDKPASISGDEDDWVRAVASLIRRTEEGKIKWKSGEPPAAIQSQADVVFTAEYEGKRLRLYMDTSRYISGEVVLEIGDDAEAGWYAVPVPKTQAAWELLESVKYQVYGVSDFLTKILKVG